MAGTLAGTIDVYLLEDLKLEMPTVSGNEAVAQRLYRALTTPRGMFPFWPNRGINVSDFVLSKVPGWQIKLAIEAECRLDEQVDNVQATITSADGGKSMKLVVRFTTEEGSYAFTMNVTEAAATYVPMLRAA